MKDWLYRHIGGPLGRSDWRYLVFLLLMTWLSTALWLVGAGVL